MSIPTDEEKWIPSPVPKLATTRTFFGGSPRKRQILTTGGAIFAAMVLGSWYWCIGELPHVGDFWQNTGEGMCGTQFHENVPV